MNGLTIIIAIGMILTLVFIGFLVKELKKSIKESNEGKVSKRCELD